MSTGPAVACGWTRTPTKNGEARTFGEMLLIQNKRVNWDTQQIGIPGATAKDKENRRIPFNLNGRLAAILKRRAALGPEAYVFGGTHGAYNR